MGTDVLVWHYSSHLRLQVSLFLHYFNNRLPDYTVSQPRHYSFHLSLQVFLHYFITAYQTTRYHNPEHYNINPFIKHLAYPLSVSRHNLPYSCVISGFRRSWRASGMMRGYRVSVPSSRVNQSNSFWTAWRLQMGMMLSRNDGNKLPSYAAQQVREQTLLPYWYFIHYHRRYIISATDSVVK